MALAAPLRHGQTPLVLNVSVSTRETARSVERELAPILMKLAERIEKAMRNSIIV